MASSERLNMALSVLQSVAKADVVTDPFPHVVVEHALPDELCAQLIEEFPPLDVVTEGTTYGSNERFSYSAAKALHDPAVSAMWKDVLAFHTSTEFLQQVVSLFEDQIRDRYPSIETSVRPLDTLRAGVRKADDFNNADVLLDAQICVNTPVTDASTSVRGPHTDVGDKLFAGLYYLRSSEDRSTGGDLEICRFAGDKRHFRGQFIDQEHVERVHTVHYERNTLVLFLNTIDSLHAVTPRSTTDAPRLFLNLLGAMREPLFDHGPYQAPRALGDRLRGYATRGPWRRQPAVRGGD